MESSITVQPSIGLNWSKWNHRSLFNHQSVLTGQHGIIDHCLTINRSWLVKMESSTTVSPSIGLNWSKWNHRSLFSHADSLFLFLFFADDICNRVRYLGTIGHPYTPHKYIVCGKELNIMECPGNTCYDATEENCVQCKATRTYNLCS